MKNTSNKYKENILNFSAQNVHSVRNEGDSSGRIKRRKNGKIILNIDALKYNEILKIA